MRIENLEGRLRQLTLKSKYFHNLWFYSKV